MDEYGACFHVLEGRDGQVRTVYRAHVLNADPSDPDEVDEALEGFDTDPRDDDVTGAEAAAEAASLFGVAPEAMVAADASYRETAWQELGVVGGPFPWWAALQLPWPEPW